jgi:hypothetical protein
MIVSQPSSKASSDVRSKRFGVRNNVPRAMLSENGAYDRCYKDNTFGSTSAIIVNSLFHRRNIRQTLRRAARIAFDKRFEMRDEPLPFFGRKRGFRLLA